MAINVFSLKAATKCIVGLKKGRYPQIQEVILCFVTLLHEKNDTLHA